MKIILLLELASDAEGEHCKNSTAQTAAAWPERVTTGDPSDCHSLAVLSHEPLNKKPGRVTRAHTRIWNKDLKLLVFKQLCLSDKPVSVCPVKVEVGLTVPGLYILIFPS